MISAIYIYYLMNERYLMSDDLLTTGLEEREEETLCQIRKWNIQDMNHVKELRFVLKYTSIYYKYFFLYES